MYSAPHLETAAACPPAGNVATLCQPWSLMAMRTAQLQQCRLGTSRRQQARVGRRSRAGILYEEEGGGPKSKGVFQAGWDAEPLLRLSHAAGLCTPLHRISV